MRSHPSPSHSSGHLQPKAEHDDHRASTQPPPVSIERSQGRILDFFIITYVLEPKVKRDVSEQSHKKRTQDMLNEDPKRLVEAEIYLQDAIDYVDTHQQLNETTQSGFVMEEDMLLSSDKMPPKMQNISADPTSRLVPTNEVNN